MKELDKLPISEESFSSTVEDLLKTFGWRYFHPRPARVKRHGRDVYETAYSGDKGFPDYVATRGGVCLFIELKSEKGRLSEDQREWMAELTKVAVAAPGKIVQYWVFRPRDYDRILEVLR